MSWKIYSYSLPLSKPLLVLGDKSREREGLVIQRECSEGIFFAEIAPLPSFHRISLRECYQEILSYLSRGIRPKHPINQFALSCLNPKNYVDIELQCNGLGSFPVQKPVNFSLFQTVKFKIARNSIAHDVQYLREWSQQYPEIIIRLDGNRSWTRDQLISFFDQVSDLPIEYIEDPLRDPRQYDSILDIPIALDESLVDHPEMRSASCITHLIIKPTLHAEEQINRFLESDRPLVFTSTFESSLGIWHIAQKASRYSPEQTHGLATLDWFATDLSPKSVRLDRGRLHINRNPPVPDPALLKLQFST